MTHPATKVWSKFQQNTTAVVLGEPDYKGLSPAYVTDPVHSPDGPFVSAIKLEEWSKTEVVPIPHAVPDVGYLVMYGDDPSSVKYTFHDTEVGAALDVAKRPNAFGYTTVAIRRYGMSTPTR